MASEGSVLRHIVRQSTLEEANRIYPNSIQDSTGNGLLTPSNGKPYPFFVPSTVKSTLGSPTALAIGAFSTTLTTLSFALMEWRGLSTTNVFIGNFFFVAGIGMVISAQWELVLGNSFGYTALSAFGFFYGGFGAILTPFFGVSAAYGTDTAEYNNALGFFVLMWTVLNTFFLIGSLPINLVYIGIFFFVELAFGFVAASYFAAADGYPGTQKALAKAGGAFAFCAGMLGYYTVAHLMCSSDLILNDINAKKKVKKIFPKYEYITNAKSSRTSKNRTLLSTSFDAHSHMHADPAQVRHPSFMIDVAIPELSSSSNSRIATSRIQTTTASRNPDRLPRHLEAPTAIVHMAMIERHFATSGMAVIAQWYL
ncbi:hypothetical protein VTL71DRAFT_2943 [Oculimacula yallundae]|uniref:Uncharacterized protein n=1 Tax=Oculimacula yallundae TaxID=86028 RepID=A0ABR4C5P6_9HELO